MWNCSVWVLLPPVFSLCSAVGLWVVYFVAVQHENITPLWSQYRRRNGSFYPPYISIAGNFPPASCIFSEVMNLAAFGGFVIAVLRYRQLKNRLIKPALNIGSLVAFSVACFGMTVLGNFQLFSQEMIHNWGTSMTFGLGTLFCWMQSFITLRVNLWNEGRKTAVARFLLSGSITVSLILYFLLMAQGLHMHAARCQWVLVMFFLIFISTFAVEFRHSSFAVAYADTSGGSFSQSETSEAYRQQLDQL